MFFLVVFIAIGACVAIESNLIIPALIWFGLMWLSIARDTHRPRGGGS